MCCCPTVHLLDELGKAGRLERLDVRSRHRPLKMKDWCVVRGRGENQAGQWALAPSLIASQTRPTLPPVMSRGPDYGVNYSYPVSWERGR